MNKGFSQGREVSPRPPQAMQEGETEEMHSQGREVSPRPPQGVQGDRPKRKILCHAAPTWARYDTDIFFITLNNQIRGGEVFCLPEVWAVAKEAITNYHGRRWWVHLWVGMPDHMHALVSFPNDVGMGRVLSDWKRFVARAAGIKWQDGFFDHRLRKEESFLEKAHYIRQNPVRAGLIQNADDWPYQWMPVSAENPQGVQGRIADASERHPYP